MSRRSEAIVCRRCDAVFPLAEGNCPECGGSVRSRLGLAAVVAAGLVVLYLSVSPIDALSALVGLVLIGIGVTGFRGRRRRVREARERRGRKPNRSGE